MTNTTHARTFNASHKATNNGTVYLLAVEDDRLICAGVNAYDADDCSVLQYATLSDLRHDGFVVTPA